MSYITEFLTNFWILTNDMSIYILVGVIIAGFLKQLIPQNFIIKHLGKNNIFSIIKASLFGAPLPLCSCSVIPFATALKKEGASNSSVLSFLISTPITGADSILATYSFFGFIFTIYRVITSLIIAIFAGIFQMLFDDKSNIHIDNSSSCCCNGNCSSKNKKFSLKQVFEYAIFDIFKDFAKPLFYGLIAGALITTFMPQDLISFLNEYQYLSYILILIISMPLYICATASLPLAASLVASGVSMGVAFILLSAGPATNSVTMGVVAKTLGKKSLIIYLFTIAVFSVIFGYLLDLYFPNISSFNVLSQNEEFGIINQISSIMLLGLMLYFIKR